MEEPSRTASLPPKVGRKDNLRGSEAEGVRHMSFLGTVGYVVFVAFGAIAIGLTAIHLGA
jgi:hypothetical protein